MFCLATVIPKYKALVDSIPLDTERHIVQAQQKIWDIYKQFEHEYKLDMDPLSDAAITYQQGIKGTQLATDMKDTHNYIWDFSRSLYEQSSQQMWDGFERLEKVNEWLSSPWTVAMVAIVFPIVAFYGAKLWVRGIEAAKRDNRVAVGVTIAGLSIIMLLSGFIY